MGASNIPYVQLSTAPELVLVQARSLAPWGHRSPGRALPPGFSSSKSMLSLFTPKAPREGFENGTLMEVPYTDPAGHSTCSQGQPKLPGHRALGWHDWTPPHTCASCRRHPQWPSPLLGAWSPLGPLQPNTLSAGRTSQAPLPERQSYHPQDPRCSCVNMSARFLLPNLPHLSSWLLLPPRSSVSLACRAHSWGLMLSGGATWVTAGCRPWAPGAFSLPTAPSTTHAQV